MDPGHSLALQSWEGFGHKGGWAPGQGFAGAQGGRAGLGVVMGEIGLSKGRVRWAQPEPFHCSA